MKKLFHVLSAILPHIVIDMAVVFAVFLVLNNFNPMMEFLSNFYTRILLVIFCTCAFLESILLIHFQRKE